jgi:hypothetical protein
MSRDLLALAQGAYEELAKPKDEMANHEHGLAEGSP